MKQQTKNMLIALVVIILAIGAFYGYSVYKYQTTMSAVRSSQKADESSKSKRESKEQAIEEKSSQENEQSSSSTTDVAESQVADDEGDVSADYLDSTPEAYMKAVLYFGMHEEGSFWREDFSDNPVLTVTENHKRMDGGEIVGIKGKDSEEMGCRSIADEDNKHQVTFTGEGSDEQSDWVDTDELASYINDNGGMKTLNDVHYEEI